jgi:DNA ligase-1
MKGVEANADLSKLRYPIMASPKLDGIRGLIVDGKLLSASFKPIPNYHTRTMCEKFLPEGFDGELFVKGGTEIGHHTSAFMSASGRPDFTFNVFDYVNPKERNPLCTPYRHRMQNLRDIRNRLQEVISEEATFFNQHVTFLLPRTINTQEELQEYIDVCLRKGYEGVMVRSIVGPYKCGRSTEREGFLLKIKPFEDGEAEIIGFMEQMENKNEVTESELGLTKRSSHKEGKVPKDTLGKFVVRRLHDGLEFRIGTGRGLTAELRKEIWEDQKRYVGKIVKYKHQAIGAKTAPRIAIFLGFRDVRDMTTY